jgi:hypothetical protein
MRTMVIGSTPQISKKVHTMLKTNPYNLWNITIITNLLNVITTNLIVSMDTVTGWLLSRGIQSSP